MASTTAAEGPSEDWVNEDIASLTILREHDCLVTALEYLLWEELNTFALTSKGCHRARCHSSLDQTRSGTIVLGNGASNTVEFIEKVNTNKWADKFQGNMTHLRIKDLPHLSAKIDPINEAFIQKMTPMKQVLKLDCSIRESNQMLEYAENLEKGLAQGLILSLLFPNLREITLNCLPLTVLGISLIAEGNKSLRVVRWERSIIWPISDQATGCMLAFQNITELHKDGVLLGIGPRSPVKISGRKFQESAKSQYARYSSISSRWPILTRVTREHDEVRANNIHSAMVPKSPYRRKCCYSEER